MPVSGHAAVKLTLRCRSAGQLSWYNLSWRIYCRRKKQQHRWQSHDSGDCIPEWNLKIDHWYTEHTRTHTACVRTEGFGNVYRWWLNLCFSQKKKLLQKGGRQWCDKNESSWYVISGGVRAFHCDTHILNMKTCSGLPARYGRQRWLIRLFWNWE